MCVLRTGPWTFDDTVDLPDDDGLRPRRGVTPPDTRGW